jgi:hypothetical protein
VFLALQGARLLVPVLAVPGDVEVDAAGPTREKTSDMATVLVTGRDGRRAMLGFTSVETLAAWRADARPVPVAAPLVARSAIEGLARGWMLADTGQGLALVEEVDDDEVSE